MGAAEEKEDDGQDAGQHENNVNAALRGGSVRVDFWGHGVESVLGSWGKF